MTNIAVRRHASGLITLGDPSAIPLSMQGLVEVAGGAVVVDVSALADPLSAVVTEPDLAEVWLVEMYGAAAAEAVLLLADISSSEDPEPQDVEAAVVESEFAAFIRRLGLGAWLHRWWPSGLGELPELDFNALLAELGALSWLADPAFLSSANATALVSPLGRYLATEHDRAADLSGRLRQLHDQVITKALGAFVELADERAEGYAECLAAWSERLEVEPPTAGSDPPLARFLPPLEPTEFALIAGHAEQSKRGTVDWLRVPPRVFDPNEGAVSWTVREQPAGFWRVELAVGAAARWTSADSGCLLRVSFGPQVLGETPLRLTDEVGQLRYVAELSIDMVCAAEDLLLDICEANRPPELARGLESLTARRERTAIRAIFQQRIDLTHAWGAAVSPPVDWRTTTPLLAEALTHLR